MKSAAYKGEESRQVLLLMGPGGAGKSALVESIKASLEVSCLIASAWTRK